jgi:hypothetical protein
LNDRRRIFKQIIVKCVLQLLLIETTNDLLRNDEVYRTIPPEHLLRLMGVLDHSYQFARMFNEDKELRTGLWKVGEFTESSNGKEDPRETYGLLIRIYETPSELAETGIKQCCDIGAHPLANVLRSPARAPNCSTTGRGTITTVGSVSFSCPDPSL